MSQATAIGIVTLAGATILVGRGVLARHRRGEPVARSAMLWVALFGLAFVVAYALDRR